MARVRPTIVIDTREQLPYSFEPDEFDVVRRALPAADYSLDGHELSVAIERKTLDDFVATAIRYKDRFERELRLLSFMRFAAVVVEGSLDDVLEHRYSSHTHPNAVFGVAVAITVDFNVPVFFAGNREHARRLTAALLARFHKRVTTPCAKR